MTHDADWITEPSRRGWLNPVTTPPAKGRPSTLAISLGALGVLAFVASLAMRWQSIVVGRQSGSGEEESSPITYTTGATSPELLGFGYVLGVLVLLALAGAVTNRLDLALRVRYAVAGLAAGVLGIVVAITATLRDQFSPSGPFGLLGIAGGRNVTMSLEPGVFCAYGAVVLPAVAIWLVGQQAARAARRADAELADAGDLAGGGFPPGPVTRTARPTAAGPRAWSAEDAGPLDLTVTPER